MALPTNYKEIVDHPDWFILTPQPVTDSGGSSFTSDLRNDSSRNPLLWQVKGGSAISFYDPRTDEWSQIASIGLSSITSCQNIIFVPSAGPNGTLSSGNTTTTVNLSTALPSAVGINQLANRGDGQLGFKIRIIGNGTGGSGKTSESFIVANTSGTTPTLTLSPALSFSPVTGDRYEILSGRLFVVGSGPAWKYYDLATNSFSGSLTVTNLGSVSQNSQMVVLDEQYVPNTQSPGGGFFGTLTATGSGGSSLTGQASGGDSGVATNEYRNFQIRIVQDTTNTTAVGQRRRISSHTAGPSPVYTLSSAWAVTPSTTAQYVIEGNGDVLLWYTSSVVTYSYAAGGFAADAAWSTAATAGGAGQYANRGSAPSTGSFAFWGFGVTIDTAKNTRYSMIHSWRGGGNNSIDVFDFAAAAQGTWSNGITYGLSSTQTLLTTGSCAVYDPITNGGRYIYINVNGLQDFLRYDLLNRVLGSWTRNRYTVTASAGNDSGKLGFVLAFDGTNKVGMLVYARANGNTEIFGCYTTVT